MALEAELIKSKILLSEIVSKKVSLQNKGNSGYVGLCPFHKENTPSFFVNDAKQSYHCFGCGAHGDAFTFLMQYEGISYKDALERLAYIAGVEFQKQTPKVLAKIEKNKLFYQIYKKAADFFHQQLFSEGGKKAMNYILSRGITSDTIKRFKLGFAPKDSSSFIKLLRSQFQEKDLFDSGIIQSKNNFTYNPFFNRLIFPIQNKSEDFIAFGGRIIDEGQPKYLNSAENPIFHKSDNLYGYHFAKPYIHRQKEVLVVEGYMDVIALANHGIYNVVAPLGANIKLAQVEMLWGMCSEPTICFDDDEAGQNAAIKIAHKSLQHLSHNRSLNFTKLVRGKDPDEVIKNNGVDFFLQLLRQSAPLVDYIFNHEANKFSLNTPEKKVLLKKNLEKLAGEIKDPAIRKNYMQHLLGRYYDLLHNLRMQGYKDVRPTSKLDISQFKLNLSAPDKDQESLFIITILCNYPTFLEENEIIEELVAIDLPDFLDKIRKILLDRHFGKNVAMDSSCKDVNTIRGINSDILEMLPKLKGRAGYGSIEDARINLLRAFDIKKVAVIKRELEQIKTQLLVTIDDKLMKKMLYLKEYEQKLENRLRKY